ncbi:MAG: type II toxin-antitoxin system death-on-curing family toxin [Lachnospiraceae bacterium]|nr:type II toxin-antitoxin system death-on-curing family toxin [Lachnospiraceae bacterium]
MKSMTKEQILMLHHTLIETYGGDDGMRDEKLLDSALAAPFQTFNGQYLFENIQKRAARLGYGIISNHPFIDGNKRIGVHTMLVFLAINGIELEYTQKELYEIILAVAAGEAELDDLINWVVSHEM